MDELAAAVCFSSLLETRKAFSAANLMERSNNENHDLRTIHQLLSVG